MRHRQEREEESAGGARIRWTWLETGTQGAAVVSDFSQAVGMAERMTLGVRRDCMVTVTQPYAGEVRFKACTCGDMLMLAEDDAEWIHTLTMSEVCT